MFGELEQLSKKALCATQTYLNKNNSSHNQYNNQKVYLQRNGFPYSKIDLCSCTLFKRGQNHLQDRKFADIGGFDEWTRKKDIYLCPFKKWPEGKNDVSPNLCQ